jgi:hypothetical protein
LLPCGHIASAYDSKYGWPVTITDENMFDAPYGAPSAGPAPYRVYEITPRLVYAFGTSDNLGVRSTRFHLPSTDSAFDVQQRRVMCSSGAGSIGRPMASRPVPGLAPGGVHTAADLLGFGEPATPTRASADRSG